MFWINPGEISEIRVVFWSAIKKGVLNISFVFSIYFAGVGGASPKISCLTVRNFLLKFVDIKYVILRFLKANDM